MRIPRILAILLVLLPASGGGAVAAAATDVWSGLAGMREELEAQQLELRDELISAHISYLSALSSAISQLESLQLDDPRHAPAWARAEYLLETAFRLLESTGEYDAFLKATVSLRPERVRPPEPIEVGAAFDLDSDPGGGLRFMGPDGRSLRATPVGGVSVLVDAEDSLPVKDSEAVAAFPATKPPIRDGGYVNLVRSRAAWLRALAFERTGRMAEARTEVAALGIIRDWIILGPLDDPGESQAYGNELPGDLYRGVDVTYEYPGKGGTVRWRPFSSADALGRFVPGALFRGEGMKWAYAMALVHSPKNAAAVLRFGSNAPALAAVNNFNERFPASGGTPDPDQRALNVWLRKGWNVVLFRTGSSSENWSLSARVTLPDGAPFPCYVAKTDMDNLGAVLAEARSAAHRTRLDRFYKPEATGETGGMKVLWQRLEAAPSDARANFYLASFLVAKRMMEGPDRFDRERLFRRAIEYSGGDPFFILMAARAVDYGVEGPDREENLRLVLLKSVADRGAAAALTDIGRLYLDVMRQPRRADEYAEMALSVNQMSLRAGVLDYDVAVAMDWQPVAHALLDQLVRRHPSAAAARLRLGRASLAAGRYRQALTEYYAILGSDAGNHEALDGAVVALGMLGQTSAALELLVRHTEAFPYDFWGRMKLAGLYRTLGRDQETRAVLDAALALAPDDAQALAMRSELERAVYAEGKAASPPAAPRHRQELDLTPARVTPPNGWEFLYFQVEDRLEKSGALNRTFSFAVKIYTPRAAKALRHLGFWLDQGTEHGAVTRLELVHASGVRESFTPPRGRDDGDAGILHLPPLESGVVLEAEVTIRRERSVFLGDYFGHIAPLSQQAPVRLSRYMFTHPKERRIFFRPANGAPEAMEVVSPDGSEVTRIWEMSDLPGFLPEPYSPGQYELAPCVQVSSFGDWNEFARWYWRFIGVQYHAPPELQTLARHMEEGETVALAKLDKAAAWISRNIGHREWEYGPYAFRPINARSVLSRLSADGKDRTLLLCLLAREYGLQAWPVLARLRTSGFAASGAGELLLPLLDHFNYSLTRVESTVGGSIFLDASNPYRPPGVMPSQLFGSPGVTIMPDGAEMGVIPDDGVAACEWRETADLTVDEDGSASWEESATCTGTAAEILRSRFRDEEEGADAWSDFLVGIGAIPSAASHEFSEDASSPASASWKGRARLRELASIDNNRVILPVPPLPGGMSSTTGAFKYPLNLDEIARQGERRHPLLLPHGFRISRRIGIRYPDGWKLVNRPVPFSNVYSFGSLSVNCDAAPGNLTLEFTAEIPGYAVAAEDFAAFREMAALIGRWARPVLVWEKP